MTPRELVITTLNHQGVERVPRDLWYAPSDDPLPSAELAVAQTRFPPDIILAEFEYALGRRGVKQDDSSSTRTDAWGCQWAIDETSGAEVLSGSPLSRASAIAAYDPPFELIDKSRRNQSRLDAVNRACAETNRFVLAEPQMRLFDQLRLLRGPRAALKDLEAGTRPIHKLLAKLHEFYCQELEMWAGTGVDGIVLRDDWGANGSLEIPSAVWRELFRPLYRQYCKIVQDQDKFVFFRSDGNTSRICGDFVRIGVDAVHGRFSPSEMRRLADRYRGQITFWGSTISDELIRTGDPKEIRQAVLNSRNLLDFGSGGLIAQCRWMPQMPLRNLSAFFEQWLVPMPMHTAGRPSA